MTTMEQRFIEAIQLAYEEQGEDAFFGFFDADANAEDALKDGFFGFAVSTLREPVPSFLSKPQEKVALEIGFGGGRLLHAAAHMFRKVIGVDIHAMSEVVEKFLRSKGVSNFELHTGNGKDVPVGDSQVDFVYSEIVFIHFSSPEVFESYVRETFRVLKPGGLASLYYGRPFPFYTRSNIFNVLYRVVEPVKEFVLLDLFGNGYRCRPDGRARSVSLMVTRRRARNLAKSIGFQVLGLQSRGGWSQGRIVLGKPPMA